MFTAELLPSLLEYASSNRLEALGAVLGLLCVWLLMRQNIWTWPLGAFYAVISIGLFWEAELYGQFALHIYFLTVNLYGWYHWWSDRPTDESVLPVTRTGSRQLLLALVASAVLIVLLAAGFDTWTNADLAWLDMGITVLSVTAMWLSAQKKLESWLFWLVIDVAYTIMFLLAEHYFYLLLYLVYVPMAAQGYLLWRRSMTEPDDADRTLAVDGKQALPG